MTHRRFIYVLPQGSDIAPVVAEARGWLDALGMADDVALHATTGIWAQSFGLDWREDMHRPAIVIGSSEVLASKALNRAFGVGSSPNRIAARGRPRRSSGSPRSRGSAARPSRRGSRSFPRPT